MRRSAGIALVTALVAAVPARADPPVYTLAGGGHGGGELVTDRQFDEIADVAVDPRGDLGFTDARRDRVRVVSPRGRLRSLRGVYVPDILALQADGTPLVADEGGIVRLTGAAPEPFAGTPGDTPASSVALGDGLPAPQAALLSPGGLALAPDGSVYISDQGHARLRRVRPDGTIVTVAGNGSTLSHGNGGPALAAGLQPGSIAVTTDGSLLVIDSDAGLRRVSPSGTIASVPGLSEDVWAVAGMPDGGAAILQGDRVVRLSPDGSVAPLAGTGDEGFSGDGGPATQAQLRPAGLAVAPDGSVVIADAGNNRVRRVRPDGVIETVAGTGDAGYAGDGGPATAARLDSPLFVAVAANGAILVADASSTPATANVEQQRDAHVRRIAPDGTITTLAGGPAAPLRISTSGIAPLPDGGCVVADSDGARVLRIGPGGAVSLFAGTADPSGLLGDGGPALGASVSVSGLAVAPDGAVLVADPGARGVRRIAPGGTIDTVARLPALPTPHAKNQLGALRGPLDVVVAPGGLLAISSGRIQRIAPDGSRRVVGGNGRTGDAPDGARATRGPIDARQVAALPHGGYVVVTASLRLRKVDRHGRIHTLVPAALGTIVRSVAVDADGGILFTQENELSQTGARVRYLAPAHARRLAVALAGVRHGRVRAVTTRPAHVRFTLLGSHRRVAGHLPRRGPVGVRALAVRGAERASAQGVIVLGGRLTVPEAGAALGASMVRIADEFPYRELAGCRRHGPRKLDCEIEEGEEPGPITCVSRGQVVLGRDALVRARESACITGQVFRRRPHWLGSFEVASLLG